MKMRGATVLFLGWFGPRGIASILYALLIVEECTEPLRATVMLTVLLSVFLHGLTAHPGAEAYAVFLEKNAEEELAENEDVSEMPLRLPAPT